MKLEHSLLLNRWLHAQLGARELDELKRPLQEPEPAVPGRSRFFRALAERTPRPLAEEKLREYDDRIQLYEERLARTRGGFEWLYFQYLALLYTELLLDRLTDDPAALLHELNRWVDEVRRREGQLANFPDFVPGDLRRLAFFMATGSGKTLLLHANLWQVWHYLEHGRHPEALARRADGRREFGNVLLVTPHEELSAQHLQEFARSGIDAEHLVHGTGEEGWLFGPRVRVVEISKLAEEVSRDGLSVPLDALGSTNLVFVDEGHKGNASEQQSWKEKQKRLSADGLLLEYSATFAQSVAAAPRPRQPALRAEYGKAIVFDYSYRHFYKDRYGKHFRVLNLQAERDTRADELLLGGLLTYYQQLYLFHEHADAYRSFHPAAPLWVFLGARVVQRSRQDLGDVARVLTFLRRFLEEPAWAQRATARTLAGESGFTDAETHADLFAPQLGFLTGSDPNELYGRICAEVFHGRGALEVWELKQAPGEFGRRVSSPAGGAGAYFGVVNIGDPSAFKQHLQDDADFSVQADQLTGSLFRQVDAPGSEVNVLVGARKFIEGWSSWRVSTMGLLNLGRGEGPQVIQLFGRGVRLRGRDFSLQRSTEPGQPNDTLPPGLEHLETLYIFGWNADYIAAFRKMLDAEGLDWEREIPVLSLFDPWPELYVPRPKPGYSAAAESWTLTAEPLGLVVDLTPQIATLVGHSAAADDAATRARAVGSGQAARRDPVDFADPRVAGLLDLDALYADVLEYKARPAFANLYVPREVLLPVLRHCSLYLPPEEQRQPEVLQEAALRVLRAYLDRFAARREREAEGRHLVPARLATREQVLTPYRVKGTSQELLREVEALLAEPRVYQAGGPPLPRLHIDRHLYAPLLLDPKERGVPDLTLSPPGLKADEAEFIRDLADFWRNHHDTASYLRFTLYLLRNQPGSGVSFFRRSGFYPDFVIWLRDEASGRTRGRFVEPHGMHHGGLSHNSGKIEALRELEERSTDAAFVEAGLEMSGYIVTRTELSSIPGAEPDWDSMRTKHRVLRQGGAYIEHILGDTAPRPAEV
ncbi:MAG: DEAD/DEAH box helicase family protein [Longimicrobiaceae bacterium]